MVGRPASLLRSLRTILQSEPIRARSSDVTTTTAKEADELALRVGWFHKTPFYFRGIWTFLKFLLLGSSGAVGIFCLVGIFLLAYRDTRHTFNPNAITGKKLDSRNRPHQIAVLNISNPSAMLINNKIHKGFKYITKKTDPIILKSGDDCEKKLCLPEASYLLSKLNLTVTACEDFYRFVCSSSWFGRDTQSWPYRYSSVQHIYTTLQLYVTEQLAQHGRATSYDRTSALYKTLIFLDNCTSEESRKLGEPEHFAAIMSRFGLANFPYKKNNVSGTSLHFVLAKMARELRLFPFFAVSVIAGRNRGRTRQVILLKQQAKKAHELDSLNFETFHWIIRKSASLFPDIQHFSIQQYKDVLKFSKQIALLATYRPSAPEYAEVRVSQYRKPAKFNLSSFLAILFDRSLTFGKSSVVVFNSKNYFERLFNFLENDVDLSTVLNYLSCHLWSFLSPLFPEGHTSSAHLREVSYLTPGTPRRFPLCLRFAERLCPAGIAAILTSALGHTNSTLEFIQPLEWWVSDMKEVLLNFTKGLAWFDDIAKVNLAQKIKDMRVSAIIPGGFPNRTTDILKWTCERYNGNLATLPPALHFMEAMATMLRSYWTQPQQKGDSLFSPLNNFEYEIRYWYDSNSLNIPILYFGEALKAPMVFRRFYAVKILPDVLREVVKIFLKQGSYTVRNSSVLSWWSDEAAEAYAAAAQCSLENKMGIFLDPYNFSMIEENFAWILTDAMASRLSLDLYVELYDRLRNRCNPNDADVFERGFSPYGAQQMAFIFFAETMCEAPQPDNSTYHFFTHGISAANRVRLSLASFPEFSASFRCTSGMAMHSDDGACAIWDDRDAQLSL